jgi:hypothetical protein
MAELLIRGVAPHMRDQANLSNVRRRSRGSLPRLHLTKRCSLAWFSSTSAARGSSDHSRASFYLARFASSQDAQIKISKNKLSISMIAVTPTMESNRASFAAW